MELEIWRYNGGDDATLGFFMAWRETTWELLCFTCEDEHRDQKIHGETRIPAGRYRLGLRTGSPMSNRYAQAMGRMHRGMLWILDVPGFEYCYIHIGNDDDDTLGCPLVAEDRFESSRSIGRSRVAYRRIYPEIAEAIRSENVWLTVRDCDRQRRPTPLNA